VTKRTLLLLAAAALAAPAHAVNDALFDGSGSPAAAFSFPSLKDLFGRRPATPQDELKRAAGGDADAIVGLSDAALAQATSDQKIAMLKTLIRESDPRPGGEASGDPAQPPREQAILRLLRSSDSDAASFDRVYYRIDPGSLNRALGDPKPVYDMVEGNRASVAPGDWTGLDSYIDAVADTKSSGKNTVEFLIDSGVIAPAMTVLGGAKRSIHLEVFQYQADEYGWDVAKLLAEKARAGVRVRMLLDANGSSTNKDEVKKLLDYFQQNGVQVIVKRLPLDQSHLDHRKVLVVDGDTAFTGGMNIGLSYQKDWHDQQTLIMGPAVTALQSAFLERWRAAGGSVPDAEIPDLYPPLKDQPGGAETRVVAHEGNAKDQNIRAMYLRAIGTAEKTIRIANPYFLDAAVVAELIRASTKRHVQVQVVLPMDNDVALLQRGSRAYYPDLLKAGIEVYEYEGRMAHEKVAVFDGAWSTFGSSNLDARSLRYNDELNLAVSDPGVARYIEANLFGKDLQNSKRILQYSPTLRERIDRSLEDVL
jgi:cardiolipin synthase